jgi:phage repressor protein C with HTH and peptisase S24 domain
LTRVVPAALGTELAERVIALEAPVWMRVHGDTMSPILRNGDRVAIAPAAGHPPRRGDLIAVRTDDEMALLRFVGRHPDGRVLTAAEARGNHDSAVSQAHVIGVVIEVERDGRRLGLRDGAGSGSGWPALVRTCRRWMRRFGSS